MSWIAQTLDEFGRSIGLAGLHPDAGGLVSLRIGSDRRLDLRVLEEEVLLLLARPVQVIDRLPILRRALDTCHVRHGWSLPVRAGLTRDGQLAFIARLPAREFSLPALEQAYDLLERLHERAGG